MLKLALWATIVLLATDCGPLSSHELTSLDCIHMLRLKCGEGGPVLFRVLVGPDSKVIEVRPKAEHPSLEMENAAKCLAAHTDRLDPIISRSRAPFEFDFTVGPMYC
jgi:hypothetical protein